jgi:Protein of unknown function (DUF3667)
LSHNKERKEKDCLNCGTALAGRYCHVCGQENTEPKETVWGLVSHFFNDITHFDGKFFSTVKYLIIKPGFLSLEYIKGRRASYLHPIRMYVFTSAFFFIIFFSLFNVGEIIKGQKDAEVQIKELSEASNSLKQHLPETRDSVLKIAMLRAITNIDRHVFLLEKKVADKKKKDSTALEIQKRQLDTLAKNVPSVKDVSEKIAGKIRQKDSTADDTVKISPHANITFGRIKYNSRIAYDSVQKELPEEKKDDWFESVVARKEILLDSKGKNDKKEAVSLLMEKFMHTLPQALFISLPVFALVLLILYARRKFYYVDHGIFTIHLYCATFILLVIYFAIDKLKTALDWGWLSFFKGIIALGIYFYMYKAMRKFYQQRRFKTIVKFFILLLSSLIIFILLSVIFFFLSLLQFS